MADRLLGLLLRITGEENPNYCTTSRNYGVLARRMPYGVRML